MLITIFNIIMGLVIPIVLLMLLSGRPVSRAAYKKADDAYIDKLARQDRENQKLMGGK